MLVDICYYILVLFSICASFIGFVVPACKGGDKKKNGNDPKIKNVRSNEISNKKEKKPAVKKASDKNKKKSEKPQAKKEDEKKEGEKKEGEKKEGGKKESSKKEEAPKEEGKKVSSTKEPKPEEGDKKEATKKDGDTEGKPAEPKDSSKKEAAKTDGEKKDTSVKETQMGDIKKDDTKKDEDLKETEKKDGGEKKEDNNNNDAPKPAGSDGGEIKSNKEKVVFDKVQGKATVELENKSDVKRAIKIKCSDNNTYKVNPVFSYIEAGKTLNVEIVRSSAPAKVDKIVVLNTPATDIGDAQGEFKKTEKYTTMVIPLTVQA
uniref:Major sperm protein n=1 Tax=Parastrongyloides trichosuri TaxID=131310 RepID=A0A0N4ZX11_PARTI